MILSLLDQAYDRPSWHGTNLRGSLRRVTPEQAAWRPGPARHNIWEIAVHAAYWKYAAWRRLTGRDERIVPAEGLQLVQAAGRTIGRRVAIRPRAARRDAPRAARVGPPPAGLGARPDPERQQGQQLRALIGRRRPRPLPCRPDSVAEASGPRARMIQACRCRAISSACGHAEPEPPRASRYGGQGTSACPP